MPYRLSCTRIYQRYGETPYSLTVTMQGVSLTYYYITNLQGDVLYLIDASKNVVVSYDYDPYGKIIGTNDYSLQTLDRQPTGPEDTTKTIAELNPLRYRGYYYDTDDLGFYYLQSRYYDADTCRFISVDSYLSTGLGFLGYNAFAYCNNDPISNVDIFGRWGISTLVSALIGGTANALCTAVTGGSFGEVVGSFVLGAAEGALSDGFAGFGTVARIYHTFETVINCRKSGASWGASLLAGGGTLAASFVYGRGSDLVTNAIVDSTFGFSASALSSAVETGIIQNAEGNKKEPESNSILDLLSTVGGDRSGGGPRSMKRMRY